MKSWCRHRGRLSPVVTGLVYCSVIAYCQDLFQVSRAQAWTQALTGWCEQQPEMVAHVGQCLVHRSEIMQLRGQWGAALREARRVKTRFAQSMNSSAAGHALYRQGEVYRLQGRFDQAEGAYRHAARSGYEPQPGLALLRLAQGKTTAAVSTIRRALARPRTRPAARGCFPLAWRSSSRTETLSRRGKPVKSSRNLRRVAKAVCSTRLRPSRTARWNWRKESRMRPLKACGTRMRSGGTSRRRTKLRECAC